MGWMQPLKGLLTLFLESACPLCQRSSPQVFCPACQRQLQSCRLATSSQSQSGSVPLYAWGAYGGALRRAIAAMKYNNQPHIAHPLGQWLGQGWLNAAKLHSPKLVGKPPVVVPIPLHPEKQRKRGYNQADLLAQGFCQVTGLTLQPHGLERTKETDAQFSLSADDRAQNLAGAFSVSRDLKRRSSLSVVILDDIYTTGATANSAIQAFQQHNIAVAGLVVLALAQKHSSP